MSLTSKLLVEFTAAQIGSNDFDGPNFEPKLRRLMSFASGTGADQADILFVDERSVAASSSEDLDLAGVLADALGTTIAAAEVIGIIVEADAANTNNVVVGDATAPVPLFGGTNPTVAVKPGGIFVLFAPNAAGQFTVGAGSTDDLKIANSGSGTPVVYRIAILARSA
jgi:hypothetical protein